MYIEHDVKPGGKHILIDCTDIRRNILQDTVEMQKVLEIAAKLGKATVLSSHFHHFGNDYGITGFIVLAESHISVHTWAKEKYAAIDIFMCGDCEPNTSATYIIEQLQCTGRIIDITREAQIETPIPITQTIF